MNFPRPIRDRAACSATRPTIALSLCAGSPRASRAPFSRADLWAPTRPAARRRSPDLFRSRRSPCRAACRRCAATAQATPVLQPPSGCCLPNTSATIASRSTDVSRPLRLADAHKSIRRLNVCCFSRLLRQIAAQQLEVRLNRPRSTHSRPAQSRPRQPPASRRSTQTALLPTARGGSSARPTHPRDRRFASAGAHRLANAWRASALSAPSAASRRDKHERIDDRFGSARLGGLGQPARLIGIPGLHVSPRSNALDDVRDQLRFVRRTDRARSARYEERAAPARTAATCGTTRRPCRDRAPPLASSSTRLCRPSRYAAAAFASHEARLLRAGRNGLLDSRTPRRETLQGRATASC